MTDLIKYTPLLYRKDYTLEEINESSLLDVDKANILAIYNRPKIKTMDISYQLREDGKYNSTDEFQTLFNIVLKAIWTSGFTYSEKEQEMLIPALVMEIKDEFGYLTIEEVAIALHKGSREDYGEFFGVSVKTVNVWLKTYLKTTRDKLIRKLALVEKKNKEPTISADEQKRLTLAWILRVIEAYNKYRDTGEYYFYDFGNEFYWICERNKLFAITTLQIKEIKKKALKQFKESKSTDKARNFAERVSFIHALDSLNINEINENESLKIICRHLTVPYIFESFKTSARDFEKEIMEIFNKDFDFQN